MADALVSGAFNATCPACRTKKAVRFEVDAIGGSCIRCSKVVTGLVLPTAFRGPTPPPLGEAPLQPGETPCFYSPTRRATATCSQCGVFMSSAWSARWGDDTFCLKCFEKMRVREGDGRFDKGRNLWGNMALLLVLAGFTPFFWLFSFLTAPAALAVAIWGWKKPGSLIAPSRIAITLALLLSLLQLAAWAVLVYLLYRSVVNL